MAPPPPPTLPRLRIPLCDPSPPNPACVHIAFPEGVTCYSKKRLYCLRLLLEERKREGEREEKE